MAPPSAVNVVGLSDTSSMVVADPLTVNGIAAQRAKGAKLPTTIAAVSNSEAFKSPSSGKKPKARRWDHHLSQESKLRKPSSLKGAAKYLKTPGIISLGGGLPSSENFPFEYVDIKVPSAPHFSEKETRESGSITRAGKYDVAEGKDVLDLSIVLNYGQSMGSAPMLRFVTEHTEIVHNPPYEDWQCCLTVGTSSALDIAYRMLTERGDTILSEEYTYVAAIETAAPMRVKFMGVKMDQQGLLPDCMDEILSTWDAKARNSPKPRVLYTVPSGQNPTGATQGLERRREVYRIAQKHDIFIIEDEPYYFLQMLPYTGDAPDAPPPATHTDFIKSLVPSLLSLDTDGRVMRLDSFSKIIAPGSRTGWITAPEQIVERFIRHNEVSVQTASGFSQIILHKLLDDTWGHTGFLDWLIHLRLEYTHRRDVLLHACEKYLPKEVVQWNPPMAGMFLWMKVDWHKHPKADTEPFSKIENKIFQSAIERGVLVSLGSWFRAESDGAENMFLRATFAAAPSEKMTEAIKRLGDALREVFRLDN